MVTKTSLTTINVSGFFDYTLEIALQYLEQICNFAFSKTSLFDWREKNLS